MLLGLVEQPANKQQMRWIVKSVVQTHKMFYTVSILHSHLKVKSLRIARCCLQKTPRKKRALKVKLLLEAI